MLPKTRRLSRRDLNLCNLSGKVLRFPHFLLKYSPNNLEFGRFAVVTSTKLSKSAVVRNRLRRNIYNLLSPQHLALGTDIIFFPQKSMLDKNHDELKLVFENLIIEN